MTDTTDYIGDIKKPVPERPIQTKDNHEPTPDI